MSRTAASNKEIMPFLLEGRASPRQSVVKTYLRYLQQWRQHLYNAWACVSKGEDGKDIAQKGVDDLISLVLLTEYVRQYDSTAIPCLHELATSMNQPTAYELSRRLQKTARSGLLESVFEPKGFMNSLTIPRRIFDLPWIERISHATRVTYAGRTPISLFGNFHQLCLGFPLESLDKNSTNRPGETVRRSRGIYYTPADLVDYLTFQTLRNTFDSLTPEEIKTKRILDPSCGCGAFLIAAIRYIFLWLKKHRKNQGNGQSKHLCVQERLDLVRSMILGSDIDATAVEWTIRLLWLAVWESCVLDSIDTREHYTVPIPDIGKNLLCLDFLGSSEYREPPATLRQSSINVVIGGPPFVRIEHLHKFQLERIASYKKLYRTASAGQFDLYMLFVERAIDLSADGGRLAFSISNSFLRSSSGRILRGLIADKCTISEIVEFDDSKLYADATTQIALLSLHKSSQKSATRHARIRSRRNLRGKLASMCLAPCTEPVAGVEIHRLGPGVFRSETWHLESDPDSDYVSLLEEVGTPIAQLGTHIRLGMSTGADEVFIVKRARNISENMALIEQQGTGKKFRVELAVLRPILRGRDVREYRPPRPSMVCVFPYDGAGNILNEDIFRVKYPMAYTYLHKNRSHLTSRRLHVSQPWYSVRSRKIENIIRSPKIIAGGITSGTGFSLDNKENILIHSSVVAIYPNMNLANPYLLLGILNSCVFRQFARSRAPRLGKHWHVYHVSTLREFPIVLQRANSEHSLCGQISLQAKQLYTQVHSPLEQQQIRLGIDDLVNKLYGLD